jgi:hypothetical protein
MTRKRIDPAKLKRGPIRHEQLPLTLVARINYLQTTLHEVYPQSIEVWLDEFKRDAHPDQDVVWWERLTRCYLAYTGGKELTSEQRTAAFKIIFGLCMGSSPETVENELAKLPPGALDEIAANLQERTQ